MAIKIFIALMTLLSLSNIYILTNPLDDIDAPKRDINKPEIEFMDSVTYNLDTNSTTSIFTAEKADRYRDRDQFFKPMLILNPQQLERLNAKYGRKVGDRIYLNEDVVYYKGSDIKLTSSRANYSIKDRIVVCDAPFVLTEFDNIVHGDSFISYVKEGKLNAKAIDAVVYTKD
jgi:hypothetical protein